MLAQAFVAAIPETSRGALGLSAAQDADDPLGGGGATTPADLARLERDTAALLARTRALLASEVAAAPRGHLLF